MNKISMWQRSQLRCKPTLFFSLLVKGESLRQRAKFGAKRYFHCVNFDRTTIAPQRKYLHIFLLFPANLGLRLVFPFMLLLFLLTHALLWPRPRGWRGVKTQSSIYPYLISLEIGFTDPVSADNSVLNYFCCFIPMQRLFAHLEYACCWTFLWFAVIGTNWTSDVWYSGLLHLIRFWFILALCRFHTQLSVIAGVTYCGVTSQTGEPNPCLSACIVSPLAGSQSGSLVNGRVH